MTRAPRAPPKRQDPEINSSMSRMFPPREALRPYLYGERLSEEEKNYDEEANHHVPYRRIPIRSLSNPQGDYYNAYDVNNHPCSRASRHSARRFGCRAYGVCWSLYKPLRDHLQ